MTETSRTIKREESLELSPELVLIGFLVAIKDEMGNWNEGIIPGTDHDAVKIIALCQKKIQENQALSPENGGSKWKM